MDAEIPVGDEQEGCDIKTTKELVELKKSLNRVLHLAMGVETYSPSDVKAIDIVKDFIDTM